MTTKWAYGRNIAETFLSAPWPERKMGILEKIAEIEHEIGRTQKNKG